jgi:hypothetical protein
VDESLFFSRAESLRDWGCKSSAGWWKSEKPGCGGWWKFVAVRIRVKIRNEINQRSLESVVVANAGYETIDPELTLPLKAAETLGIWPTLPEGTKPEEYRTAGGIIKLLRTPPCVWVELAGRRAKCRAVISEIENEIILSDRLCDELAIIFERPGEGIWRVAGGETRESEEPQYW